MKITLPIRPLYLRLSVTDRCNLRCLYCRPDKAEDSAMHPSHLSDEHLLALVEMVNTAVPIYKLRLTGGDPLIRPALHEFVGKVRKLLPKAEIALTTNGLLLSRQVKALKESGLDTMNISLDTTDFGVFEEIAKVNAFDDVLEGILAAKKLGFRSLKLNTVLLRHFNGQSLHELVDFATDVGCELRFIELMPIGVASEYFKSEFLSADEALAFLRPYFGDPIPLGLKGTASRYLFQFHGKKTVVGFITTISEPFCGECDRLRIDSRGWLFPCLHDYDGLDLLSLWRTDERDQAVRLIRAAHAEKKTPIREWTSQQMVRIGG
ncbi:MAG: GTP 3',8-cyclase MoaA [Leptospirillum sp.]